MANTFKTPLQKAVVGWLTAHPDVSQRELGRRAGIDHGDLGKITKGDKASLNMESAGRLAAAMGTTVEGLLDGQSGGTGPNAVRPAALTAPAAAPAAALSWEKEIPIAFIEASPFNPRDEKSFDKEGIEELAASIAEVGLLEALIVRPVGDDKYQLMGGERRFRALKLMGARTARCTLRDADDGMSLAIQIIENLQRKDLTALEEAEAFSALNKLDPETWTVQAIAKKIGTSERHVQYRIAIANGLSAPLKKKFAEGQLSIEAARTLAPLPVSVQNQIPPWAIENGDAADIRRQAFQRCIPESAAKFDVALYKGEWIEDGKERRYFSDPAQFRKLQTLAAEKKLAEVQKDWPTAKLIDADQAKELRWADTRYNWNGLDSEQRKGDVPAKWNVPKDKCQAVVWVAPNGEIRKALGVCSKSAIDKANQARQASSRSSERASGPKPEPKEHKAEREEFNRMLSASILGKPDMAMRLSLLRMMYADYPNDLVYGAYQKLLLKVFPKPLHKYVVATCDDEDAAPAWAELLKLTPAQVNAAIVQIMAGSVSWNPHVWKDEPALPLAIAKSLGIERLHERKDLEKASKPKAEKKSKSRPRAAAKAGDEARP